jgi:PHP family Zn ribbon phosphoesterase
MTTVDLHNHSPYVPEDYIGQPTAQEMVLTALAAGIEVFGLTDHFSAGFWVPLSQAADHIAEQTGRRLVALPGAELKAEWDAGDGMIEEAHIVVLFPPADGLERVERLFERVGFPRPYDGGLPYASVDVHPTIVTSAARALGGLVHLAHVDRVFGDYRLLDRPCAVSLMRDSGFSAVEVIDEALAARVREISGLPVLRSSDAHALAQIGRRTTRLKLDEVSFEGLARELTRAARVV